MLKLLGACLFLSGGIFLTLRLNHEKKLQLSLLSETIDFLRRLTSAVNSWKLPLEEAISQSTKDYAFLMPLWEQFLTEKEQCSVRKALLSAAEKKLFLPPAPKKTVLYYLSKLGTEKEAPATELYRRTQTELMQYYEAQKAEAKNYYRLTSGIVGGSCAVITILLL